MTVRPEELESAAFGMVRKGYDPTEVRGYLMAIARQVRLDDQESRAASHAANSAATQSDAQSILSAAQQTAASIRAEARRQADDIRHAAAIAAKRRLEAAADTPRKVATAAPQAVVDDRLSELKAAERHLDERTEHTEALHKQTMRLHQEATAAAQLAANDRLEAESVREESEAKLSELRSEVATLRASGKEPAEKPNFGAPGRLSSARSLMEHSSITVIDSSDIGADPVAEAVRSAVGRALRRSG